MVIVASFLAAVVALGMVVILCAGPIATWYANRRLRTLPDYTGSVRKISLALFRGRGVVEDVVFFARATESEPPLMRVGQIEIDIACREILFGRLSVALRMASAHFYLVAEPRAKPTKPKLAKNDAAHASVLKQARRWQDALQSAFPVEITALEITDSSVEYFDRAIPLPRPVKIGDIELKATGLINRAPTGHVELPARVDFTAELTGHGKIHVAIQADPMSPQPRFHCRLQLDDLDLPVWNPLLLDLAKLDLSAGTFSCVAEIEAGFGYYRGYIKPFFKDLNFHTAADARKGFFHNAAKTAMSWMAKFLESGRQHQVATKIPFEGNFEDNHVDLWTAIASLLQNAFFQGLRQGLEGTVRRFL